MSDPRADKQKPPAGGGVPTDPPPEPPRYLAWTDRWDPGKWEMPDNPTPLQRVLAGVALVIVLVMTVYVPLKVLNIF